MQPFVIWFQQRSGSSHLVSLLNSHPQIQCKGEMFGCVPVEALTAKEQSSEYRMFGDGVYQRNINLFPGRIENPTDHQTIEQLQNFLFGPDISDSAPTKLPGFKFKFPSQAGVFPEVVDQLFAQAKNINVVVLHRKNYLRRALSVLNMKRIQSETAKANLARNQFLKLPPTHFDIQEVVRLIRYYQAIDAEFSAWSTIFDRVFNINYQQLVNDEEDVTSELQQFLGVHPMEKLQSKIQKSSPDHLSELVSNSEALLETLAEEGLMFDWSE